jgi:Terminase small subunit
MADQPPQDPSTDQPKNVISLVQPGDVKGLSKTGKRCAKKDDLYFATRPKLKERRDRFIAEYIRDWDRTAAFIRSGGPFTTAGKQSWEYLHEPYVQNKLASLIKAMDEAELIDNKTILMGLITEARFNGIGASHAARVTAWKTLAQIKGMEKVVVKGDINHNVRGGVMVVPVVPGSDTWEQLASNSQKQLREDVRK